MAKIVEETFVVKLSKLVRDDETDVTALVNDALLKNIEETIQDKVSAIIVVEIEK